MAAVQNLHVFTQRHKTVAGSSLTVTGGAEDWNVIQPDQPVYDLVQSPLVDDIEL